MKDSVEHSQVERIGGIVRLTNRLVTLSLSIAAAEAEEEGAA
jgi:hypothetical protein